MKTQNIADELWRQAPTVPFDAYIRRMDGISSQDKAELARAAELAGRAQRIWHKVAGKYSTLAKAEQVNG